MVKYSPIPNQPSFIFLVGNPVSWRGLEHRESAQAAQAALTCAISNLIWILKQPAAETLAPADTSICRAERRQQKGRKTAKRP